MNKNLANIFGEHHGLDAKSIEFLTRALEKNNLPGFDYIEFKQSLAALSKMDMDIGTAIKSAFATASTVGLTKEKLLESALHYANVIAQEKMQFEKAVEKQIQQKVGSKLKEVAKLKKQVTAQREKIEQLEAQIKASQATIDSADEQVNKATENIKATQSNFENTHRSVLNQIESDIANFEKFLV